MATYIEYTLEDGSTILIEADETASGMPIKAAGGDVLMETEKLFAEALGPVRRSIMVLRQELSDLETDELEVNFGVKTTGEAGLFGVCKLGAEANFSITLKWSKRSVQ